jgi:hypothetical protein
MKKLFCYLFLSIVTLTLSACISIIPRPVGKTITVEKEGEIVIGSSNKETVRALFGTTKNVQFDNGYEVWVYPYDNGKVLKVGFADQIKSAIAGGRYTKNEFVILFSPDGVVSKTRIRLAPPPPKDEEVQKS